MKEYRLEALKRKIKEFPSIELICRPTPLYPLEKLNQQARGTKILIKRDDLTGLAFGGNKSRKLEFILADALKKVRIRSSPGELCNLTGACSWLLRPGSSG